MSFRIRFQDVLELDLDEIKLLLEVAVVKDHTKVNVAIPAQAVIYTLNLVIAKLQDLESRVEALESS